MFCVWLVLMVMVYVVGLFLWVVLNVVADFLVVTLVVDLRLDWFVLFCASGCLGFWVV